MNLDTLRRMRGGVERMLLSWRKFGDGLREDSGLGYGMRRREVGLRTAKGSWE